MIMFECWIAVAYRKYYHSDFHEKEWLYQTSMKFPDDVDVVGSDPTSSLYLI